LVLWVWLDPQQNPALIKKRGKRYGNEFYALSRYLGIWHEPLRSAHKGLIELWWNPTPGTNSTRNQHVMIVNVHGRLGRLPERGIGVDASDRSKQTEAEDAEDSDSTDSESARPKMPEAGKKKPKVREPHTKPIYYCFGSDADLSNSTRYGGGLTGCPVPAAPCCSLRGVCGTGPNFCHSTEGNALDYRQVKGGFGDKSTYAYLWGKGIGAAPGLRSIVRARDALRLPDSQDWRAGSVIGRTSKKARTRKLKES
jgi:hypothetical protein